jgi:Matrixin
MRRALIIGVVTLGGLVAVLRAQPGQRPRWAAHALITVWIDAQGAPGSADSLVERALATWTQAAGGRFALQKATSREKSVVQVRFAQADGIYGETSPHIDRRTGLIGSAEVLIAGDVAGDAVQQRIVIYLTALHELGHALGLPHTNAFDDIMYSFMRPDDGERYFGAYRRRLRGSEDIGTERATGLSPADIAALGALYDR